MTTHLLNRGPFAQNRARDRTANDSAYVLIGSKMEEVANWRTARASLRQDHHSGRRRRDPIATGSSPQGPAASTALRANRSQSLRQPSTQDSETRRAQRCGAVRLHDAMGPPRPGRSDTPTQAGLLRPSSQQICSSLREMAPAPTAPELEQTTLCRARECHPQTKTSRCHPLKESDQ